MKLSIIIATKDRAQAVTKCLDAAVRSLAEANFTDAELVVVNNNSTDNTDTVVTDWAKEASIPTKLLHEYRIGLSAARNCGAHSAQGDLIVFIDDDCEMSPSYISDLLHYDEKDTQLVLRSGSVVLADPTDLPLTIRSVSHTLHWKKPLDINGEGSVMGALIGCNMAARRETIKLIGPFDENLGAGTTCPAAEDTDYFYRAYLAGILLEMVPDMVVAHRHGRKKLSDRTKLLRNYAIGNGALAFKYLFIYPNFSRHFFWELKGFIHSLFTKQSEPKPWACSKEQILCSYIGAFRYAKALIKGIFKRHFIKPFLS